MKKIIGYCLILIALSCKSETKQMNENANQLSTQSLIKENSVVKVAEHLKKVLVTKGFTIMADIDHAKGAETVGLVLRPTRTLIFGNPKGGTLLMQQSQEIGIDLPLKLVVWEDEKGLIHTSYYNATTLVNRYGITQPEAVIDNVNNMFIALTGSSGKALDLIETNTTKELIVKKTFLNVEETFNKLKEIVRAKGLQIMAEIPHDKGAAKVNLELRPTRVLVFGNPKIGTMFMQSNQEMALDLPFKVLVYQNKKGETLLSYHDATFLTNRYGITDKEAIVQKVNIALDAITNAVIAQE